MQISVVKVITLGIIACALIFGMLAGLATEVGVPALTLVLGYLIGNADVSENKPVVSKTDD